VKRIFTRLAALVTVGAALVSTPAANAQAPTGSSPPTPRPQRIVIVNIAKVLRDFNKANFKGAEITKKREVYVGQIKALNDKIAEVNKEYVAAKDPNIKRQLEEKAKGLQRQIEDIDREAKRELTQLSNDTIVQVYQDIKQVIYDIAKTNSLDMVLCYPAASKPEDENSPQVAQLMLQTPALIPFYHSGMDITEVVVKTLNARHHQYPKPSEVTPAGGTGTTPPTGAGTPTPPIPGGGK
jgi:Skp family chaperone for outer membrane proteins